MYFIANTYLYFKNVFVYMKNLVFTRNLALEALPSESKKDTAKDENYVQTDGKYNEDNISSEMCFNDHSQNDLNHDIQASAEHLETFEEVDLTESTDAFDLKNNTDEDSLYNISLQSKAIIEDSASVILINEEKEGSVDWQEKHEACTNECTQSMPEIIKSVDNKVTESPIKILLDAQQSQEANESNDKHFKMPLIPVKKTKTKHRNTVSLVAMYIKYSPRAQLVTNVKTADLSLRSLKCINDEIQTTNTPQVQNLVKKDIDLPNVLYKPSKLQVRHVEEEMKLPPSYSRLIPINPTVIKHEKIIYGQVMSPQAISNILEELETSLKCDEHDDESDLDTSIWTMFRAYNGAHSNGVVIKN